MSKAKNGTLSSQIALGVLVHCCFSCVTSTTDRAPYGSKTDPADVSSSESHAKGWPLSDATVVNIFGEGVKSSQLRSRASGNRFTLAQAELTDESPFLHLSCQGPLLQHNRQTSTTYAFDLGPGASSQPKTRCATLSTENRPIFLINRSTSNYVQRFRFLPPKIGDHVMVLFAASGLHAEAIVESRSTDGGTYTSARLLGTAQPTAGDVCSPVVSKEDYKAAKALLDLGKTEEANEFPILVLGVFSEGDPHDGQQVFLSHGRQPVPATHDPNLCAQPGS